MVLSAVFGTASIVVPTDASTISGTAVNMRRKRRNAPVIRLQLQSRQLLLLSRAIDPSRALSAFTSNISEIVFPA
jgi:hypothetical protein